MNKFALLVTGLVVSQLIACASVQMGDPARSEELKKFPAKADAGQIYVCRDNAFIGRAITPKLLLDGKEIANIRPQTFAYAEVTPGTHKLLSDTSEHNSVMDFTIKAGETKFFQSWISMGVLSGWGIIDEMDAAKAKECIAAGALVVAVPKK